MTDDLDPAAVERVARGLFLHEYPGSEGGWDAPGDLGKAGWHAKARAALAAAGLLVTPVEVSAWPTDDEVREAFGRQASSPARARLAFDRWLAEHDAQVAARAWDEGARWALRDQGHEVTVYLADALAERNPYRIERRSQEGER